MTALTALLMASAFAFTPVKWDFTGELGLKYKGERRLYHIILPKDYHKDAHRMFPAVVLLHGNGANASAFASEMNMTQNGPDRNYLMIFGEGVQTPNTTGCKQRSWNAGACCDEALTNGVDDIAYLKEVLGDISHRHRFRVDRRKVFISGTSNGGSLTVRAMCELGRDYFAGASANVASFEGRNGASCGKDCYDGGDGYNYCEWDRTKPGCRQHDWLHQLPAVFDCNAVRHPNEPVPIMFFNGRLDPSSNVSGLVVTPINSSEPGTYNMTFPPMEYAYAHFAHLYGCEVSSPSEPQQTFHNGTAGNSTTCRSWSNCGHARANVTYCISDAGHRWYGDTYDEEAVCTYEGYNATECDPQVVVMDRLGVIRPQHVQYQRH